MIYRFCEKVSGSRLGGLAAAYFIKFGAYCCLKQKMGIQIFGRWVCIGYNLNVSTRLDKHVEK